MEKESNQKTAKQHVVPKFYLRKFANTSSSLEVYDKQWKKFSSPKSPSGVGYDLYFYAQTTGKADEISQEMEKALHEFEDFISKRYDILCKKILQNEALSEEDIYTIALHASTLWLRGYNMRTQMNQAFEGLAKRMMQFQAHHPGAREIIKEIMKKQGKSDPSDEDLEKALEFMKSGEYNIEGDNVSHLQMLGEYEGFTNLFMAKKIRVFIASGVNRFITSDAPVQELAPIYARERSFYGYAFTERLHTMPLSSEIFVEFHDPDVLSGKQVIRKRIDDEMVAAANARQFAGSQRWCAGEKKGDFYIRRSIPGVSLPVAPRVGKFEESFLGLRVG